MPQLRAPEGRRRAQRRRPADQGLADPAARHRLQGRRRTTRASRRASRSCASCSRAAATSATATRWVAELELDGDAPRERRLVAPRRSRAADCVVMLTAHRQFLDEPLWERRAARSSTRATSSPPGRTSHAHLGLDSDRCRRPGLLILGAGYIGAALAELALERRATRSCSPTTGTRPRASSSPRSRSAARASRPPTSASRDDLDAPARRPARRASCLLAAQASRPLSERDPDYTEETNLTGARRVAEAVAAPAAGGSSSAARCTSTGPALRGRDRPEHAVRAAGRPRAPLEGLRASCALAMHARRAGFGLALLRLGIVYGPSPVEHDAPESRDRRRQVPPPGRRGGAAAARRRRQRDDRRRARRGRRAASCSSRASPAGSRPKRRRRDAHRRRRRRARRGRASRPATPALTLRDRRSPTGTALAEYLARAVKLLVTGATGFLGWRVARRCSRERGHEVVAARAPGRRGSAPASTRSTARARRRRRPGRARPGRGLRRRPALRGRPRPGRRAAPTPPRAVRENAGTTLNLLEGCREHGAGLVYPSTRARGARPAPRRLRALEAPRRGGLPPPPRPRDRSSALTSVFGPGQVAWEGATGAIAASPRARSRASRS